MDWEHFEQLETRINRAVELIERLKIENQQLIQENRKLQGDSQSQELVIQQLREENQNLKQVQGESSLSKEKEEKIRSKIEQMLMKLDRLP